MKDTSILIIGTNMMNIYHHRLELIKALLTKYKIVVAAPSGGEEKELEKLGVQFIDMPVDNRGTSIINDLILIKNLFRNIKKTKPSVILTFYTKTNIYGGIVATLLKVPYIENICGLGTSLIGQGKIARLMATLYKHALKKANIVFFQNKSNYNFFIKKKIYSGNYAMLPGSGVDNKRYPLLPYPPQNKIEFLFASRILKEKGINEYLEVAKILSKKYDNLTFHVVGPADNNYLSILEKADKAGIIKYHGKLNDLHNILTRIHCTVLPSYYPEGMANILLESASSGRPIISTSLPGCGEAIEDNVNGFLIKEKNSGSLQAAIEKFINLPYELKKQMGIKGREKMIKEFDRQIVTDKYLSEIEKILNN